MGASPAPAPGAPAPMRIAIVYDCLYPHTIGGCERWYRAVAERLAARHRVTYLTRTQWEPGEGPDAPHGVEVIGLDGGRQLYTASGRRRIAPPVRFGMAVLAHLLRNRRRYDVVHTCSFPYFPLLSASIAKAAGGPPIVTDWVEVWPRDYWRDYLGTAGGTAGAAVQRLCIRLTGPAFTLSDLAAAVLRENGYRGQPVVLKGIYDGPILPPPREIRKEPIAVFVGRHIPEKQLMAIPQAIAIARHQVPDLRGLIFGDGPERPRVLDEIARLQLQDVVKCPGFAPWDEIDSALADAMCLLLPSRREGYGLVVVEAAARGTPSIVVQGADNAATSLVASGVNGFLVSTAEPAALADAIVRVHLAGPDLVRSTYGWFRDNANELSVDSSVARIEQVYRSVVAAHAKHLGGDCVL
jgi:glycosyltransferase involved in cell wall biosynthesis